MQKVIEIRKAGFTNKGAEMMLVATVQETRDRFPNAKLVVAPNYAYPFEARARLGLWHRAELIKKNIDFGRIIALVPAKLRERYGFVTQKEIDVVFDAAGFAYSDQWGLAPTLDLAKRAEAAQAAEQKFILLPQAFGPFQKEGMKDAITRAVAAVDLLFARDQKSYDYLIEAVGPQEKIRLCPDFTNLLKAKPFSGFKKGDGKVAIVPNARMLDKSNTGESGAYIAFLTRAIAQVEAAQLEPFFLVHETMDDLPLAQKINADRMTPLEIVEVQDSLVAKGIIAQCDALIGSRFHALVSALCQAVPVIGTGWSHKYQELFMDYGYEQGLTRVDIDTAAIDTVLAPLLTPESRAKITQDLKVPAHTLKASVTQMWDEVFRTAFGQELCVNDEAPQEGAQDASI